MNYISKLTNNRAVLPTVVGLVAFGAGTAFGYILNDKLRERKAEEVDEDPVVNPSAIFDLTAEDIAEMHATNEELIKEAEYDTVEKEEDDGTEEIVEVLLSEPETEPEPVEEVKSNVFALQDVDKTVPVYEGWDYDDELARRTNSGPYIVSHDEFFDEENHYKQHQLTYYAGDDTMADEQDVPVDNYPRIVGPLKFGHGSKDADIFYVRNEKLQSEYEIIKMDGHFAVEVMGHSIETTSEAKDLKHSKKQRFVLEE